MEILKGLPVANAINEKLIEEVKTMEKKPHLAIIRVGERPDDMSYERGATKKMDKVGFECTSYTFPADIDNDTFQKEFDKINEDDNIDGILLLRPLPKHLDEKAVENRIDPCKDLDGISPVNLAKVYAGDESGYGVMSAFAVSELKEEIELLSNGVSAAYLGINGTEVSDAIADSQDMPKGIYVSSVMPDSPAMQAGIQSGDILTEIGDTKIYTLKGLKDELLDYRSGRQTVIQGKRRGSDGYVDVHFEVTLGSAE